MKVLKQICWIILLKLIELGNASKFKNFSAPGLVNASSYEAKDHMKSNSKSVSEEDPGDSDVSEERSILIENEIIKLIFLITSKTHNFCSLPRFCTVNSQYQTNLVLFWFGLRKIFILDCVENRVDQTRLKTGYSGFQ